MLKKAIIVVFSLLVSSYGYSQVSEDDYAIDDSTATQRDRSNDDGFDWDKITVGGGLAVNFGSITYIDVSPTVGYYLTDNILAAVGGTYIYFSDGVYSTNVYGGRLFGEGFLNEVPILAHAELEVLNFFEGSLRERINVVNILVGGGLKQTLGDRSYLSLLVLWNINESEHSLYPNPIFRAGIVIGL